MSNLIDKVGMMWRSVAKSVLGPIHSLLRPDIREVSVSGTTAEFDHSGVGPFEYSYVDDFESERENIKDIIDEVSPDDVVFDVGANVGIYSVFLGLEVESGKVISFEPHPEAYKQLARNVEMNRLDGVVDTMNMALADQSGELGLINRAPTGHQIIDSESADTVIKARKGANIIGNKQVPKPDVLKIDVEGAEREVLEGLGETVEEFRVVYCEIHPNHLKDRGSTKHEVFDLITDAGFNIVDKSQRGEQIHIKARTNN